MFVFVSPGYLLSKQGPELSKLRRDAHLEANLVLMCLGYLKAALRGIKINE